MNKYLLQKVPRPKECCSKPIFLCTDHSRGLLIARCKACKMGYVRSPHDHQWRENPRSLSKAHKDVHDALRGLHKDVINGELVSLLHCKKTGFHVSHLSLLGCELVINYLEERKKNDELGSLVW